ncbi:MAG TPA: sugar-binding protein [Pirellulaceae bacterium]|nr:sugar-binding protein [Pirellulaceae bacterium]
MPRHLIFPVCCAAMMFGVGCSKPAPSGPSFTASSGAANTNTTSASDSTEPAATGGVKVSEKQTVAFVTNQIADFWKIAEAGCKDAEKDLDINVEVRMPSQATAVEQKRIIEDLLTSGVAAIAISPIDADNQIEWLNSIAEKVPLITHDSDAPASNRLMCVGMDNYAAGLACADLVKQALPGGGQVMLFIGRIEQDNSKFRRQGVIDGLLDRDRTAEFYKSQTNAWDKSDGELKGERFTVLGTLLDQGKSEVALAKAEDSINTYTEMDVMVGLFEYNPPACYQALKKAGKLDQIKLVGFDENEITLQAIKDGECIGTVVQNPYMYGYESARVLKALLDGDKSVIPESRLIDFPHRVITKENVDEYWADLKAKKGA